MSQVLSVTFGNKHTDWQQTADAMSSEGIELVPFLLQNDNWHNLDLSQYDAVELRHCRGWQRRWKELEPLLEKLQESGIPVINPPETFRWVLNKANYLSEIKNRLIDIIPTTMVRNSEEDIRLQDFFNEENN